MEADMGVIGGSGFYSMVEKPSLFSDANLYGKPSESIAIGDLSGKRVAFLARHSKEHTIPPHKVNYRANIEAMNSLGVQRIIATNAVGSLREDYAPGELVLFDQFVNMTHGRHDTFFDEDYVVHVSSAEPYCSQMRSIAASTADRMGIRYHKSGTVVVVNGPRFSTKAESRHYKAQGFDVINMTQYPEAILARERRICYLGIGVITDYDAGIEGREDVKNVSGKDVEEIFSRSISTVKELVSNIIKETPENRECSCASALDHAVMTKKQK
jgi:5'-methylthioadenosine phosphorylase